MHGRDRLQSSRCDAGQSQDLQPSLRYAEKRTTARTVFSSPRLARETDSTSPLQSMERADEPLHSASFYHAPADQADLSKSLSPVARKFEGPRSGSTSRLWFSEGLSNGVDPAIPWFEGHSPRSASGPPRAPGVLANNLLEVGEAVLARIGPLMVEIFFQGPATGQADVLIKSSQFQLKGNVETADGREGMAHGARGNSSPRSLNCRPPSSKSSQRLTSTAAGFAAITSSPALRRMPDRKSRPGGT